ncbi:MAG: 2-hydroxychromene-2-carboxylate isomerase [Myxococcales bacterium]|nr:2-hydroxychromene-2-carboxylate isomerase [Myxococcales bacterium]
MTGPTQVDFYFDYLSPYAYFAAERLPELCARHGAELVYHPVLFAGLLNHWGQLGPAEIPAKALYTFRDAARWAALEGLPFRAPRFHPFVPLTALRLSLAEVAEGDQARVVETLFRHGWGAGGDLGDPDALGAALDAVGLDGSRLLERARGDAAKASLRAATDAAIARGVFGIPTVAARGELLWGFDRMAHLELILSGNDPLTGRDLAPLGTSGRAADRRGGPLD